MGAISIQRVEHFHLLCSFFFFIIWPILKLGVSEGKGRFSLMWRMMCCIWWIILGRKESKFLDELWISEILHTQINHRLKPKSYECRDDFRDSDASTNQFCQIHLLFAKIVWHKTQCGEFCLASGMEMTSFNEINKESWSPEVIPPSQEITRKKSKTFSALLTTSNYKFRLILHKINIDSNRKIKSKLIL